jgi:pullulanase-type alpha-1,6-glucosidase
LASLLLAGAAAAAPAPQRAECDADFARVLQAVPTAAPTLDASAVWGSALVLRWPGVAAQGSFKLYHSQRGQITARPGLPVLGADGALDLAPHTLPLDDATRERLKWVGTGTTLSLRLRDQPRLRTLHRSQLVLVQLDAAGRVSHATATQTAPALDDLFAPAEAVPDLGATVAPRHTRFKLWAPTAQGVWLCLHRTGSSTAQALRPLAVDGTSGVWATAQRRDLSGHSYTYLVDVFVRGVGLVRNRVTDPYSVSLNTDSRRSWIGSLNAPALKPAGWDHGPRPTQPLAATDLMIYELHVRDFSANDNTVRPAWRGKYLGFAEPQSNGTKHLRAMAAAGLTDVHLLPLFDLATVPEQGCTTPPISGLPGHTPDGTTQQAAVTASASADCYNWGYDPYHFTAPEGSYATNAEDGAVRVLELRRMVQALHAAGLRVGMDVVYNHTTASGQKARSVLDRVVPGYYHRLDAKGAVERSTCCDNTATENRMMAKLMIDSTVVWARDHHIDSFRFDLMGHQPRVAMEKLQKAVNAATGRHIHLIGEGWNFGEVANGARFVQASQGSLNGSGIATFSDRGRDAARGGGCCDDATQTAERQGWLNGLYYDAKPGSRATLQDLHRTADLVRVGLAATLRSVRMTTHDGSIKALADIDYAGQGAGYASQPGEVVNYVENHDNQTLYDINVLKLRRSTTTADRARVQVLGMALTAFSQGVAYYHAGIEALRSKSLDRDSYDSGDWFNRLDWSFTTNHFGSGLPPQHANNALWPLMQPLLADAELQPTPADIRFARDAFYDLLRIRASSTLLRLRTADDVAQRLTFLNVGPAQNGAVIVGHLQGRGVPGAGFAELMYAINAGPTDARLDLPTQQGKAWVLHPVHRADTAADKRPAVNAHWDATTSRLLVPPRTALVYVLE